MFGSTIVNEFLDDPTVRLIGALWVLDFLLGTFAAIRGGSFRLSFVADTFRNDVVGKILPYYLLWGFVHLGGIDFSIGGLDVIEEASGAVVIAALVGSVLNSIRDLGFAKTLPDTLAGPDPETAAPPVVP